MREISLPGSIEICFGRDPDFFHGLGVEGKLNQTIVALDGEKVIGMGCRSVKPMYINGEETDFGYLSGLRGSERYRGGTGLARGFRFLRRLHEDKRTPAYITTVIEDNAYARKLLESGRAGLPRYIDFGKYFTFAININRWRRAKASQNGLTVVRGDEVGLEGIVSYLNRFGRTRQFFPVYRESDFHCAYTRDFDPVDFYIAIRGTEIVGVLGKWDQSAFKQSIVMGYAGLLGALRRPINVGLRIAGFKALPDTGERLRMFYVSFVCVRRDDPEVLEVLLDALYQDNRRSGYHYCMVGFHERDELQRVVRRYIAVRYTSRLYLVTWEDGLDVCLGIDKSRIPYLELGTI
jgi:hypothetical protein